ncbi:GNAT family N-acetyltransferase [Rhodospira trueperi]|uniref:Ribosomal protein S18 acetylase RimI n=1 Tax=Rhodospira trueperi TaxID=69960 RepID=A0A1G7ED41_9PROT|nr:GNAT family N-acetyltransferase [Rhodospira trueperi]SDE61559.1 Ribosomal protein S18 acetylase RimI [Rhodospira trueperi]
MIIRPFRETDGDALWRVIEPAIRAGETYALPRDMTRAAAVDYWCGRSHETFVAEDGDGGIVGTYYMRPNQKGGGAHVANCGYVTRPDAGGRGIARAMGEHSLNHAKARGFHAIQFNCVVSTNTRAVALWQRLEFQIVGTLPGAFEHPRHGFVDAYIMYRHL